MRPLPALPEWVTLEHDVAKVLTQQEDHGWYFDVKAARELECSLRQELHDITQVLQDRFPFIPGKEFTPKRDNKLEDMWKVPRSKDSKTLIPPHETT